MRPTSVALRARVAAVQVEQDLAVDDRKPVLVERAGNREPMAKDPVEREVPIRMARFEGRILLAYTEANRTNRLSHLQLVDRLGRFS